MWKEEIPGRLLVGISITVLLTFTENSMEVPKKFKNTTTTGPAILLPRKSQKKMKSEC